MTVRSLDGGPGRAALALEMEQLYQLGEGLARQVRDLARRYKTAMAADVGDLEDLSARAAAPLVDMLDAIEAAGRAR